MAGDDLVLDLVVRGLREDAASDELIFRGIRATVDDAFCVGIADTVEGLELVRRGRVDVEGGCRGSRRAGWF
jgi:hypothetical protein